MNLRRTASRLPHYAILLLAILLYSLTPAEAQWTSVDIGSVGAVGSDSYNSTTGVYTLNGSGGGFSGTADAAHYVYQTLTGDGELEARITSMTNTNVNARAAVMIRQSTAVNSINFGLSMTPSGGPSTLVRPTTIAAETSVATGSNGFPYWVKVIKDGNIVSYYQSADGITWAAKGTQTLAFSGSVDLGLAVTSHVAGTICTATFDNITFTAQPNFKPLAPWLDADIGSPANTGGVHFNPTLWSVYGGGAGFVTTSDQFHFGYQPLTGNGVVVAQVQSQSSSTGSAGVIMRQGLTAGSAEATVVVSPTNACSFLTRTSAGATLATAAGATSGINWVKLVRTGTTFAAYQSTNGTTWAFIGSQTITMTDPIYIGIAHTSGVNSSLAAAVFNQVGAWTGADVSTVTIAGSDSYDATNNIYTITGSGASSAAFHYVWQSLTGDGELQARIVSQTNTNSFATAGIMFRQSTDPNAMEMALDIAPSYGIEFFERLTYNGTATNTQTSTHGAPYWVRLVRDGNQINALISSDGVTWSFRGNATYSTLVDPIDIGFNVSSHNTAAASTAVFDNIICTQGLVDSDANGLPDYWEIEYYGGTGAKTGYNANSDPIGNGLTLLQDYEEGNNPTNYYSQNGQTLVPTLTVSSGTPQFAAPSMFAAQPLVVQVVNSIGRAPMSNAPVVFTTAPSGGLFAATSGGATSSSFTAYTNASGVAQAYFKEPSTSGAYSTITATSGGQTVTFASYAGGPPNSGLALWLRADSGVPAVGSAVTSWVDQSGAGNNANQGNSSLAPIVEPPQSDLNNQPVLRFGSGNYLDVADNASLSPTNAVTVIAVAKPASGTGPYYLDVVSRPLTYSYYGYWVEAPTYSYELGIDPNNTERGYCGYGSGASGLDSDISGPAARPFLMSISTLVDDGTNVNLYSGGITQATAAAGGSLNYDTSSPHDLYIGLGRNYAQFIDYFSGDIAEVLIYNRALTATEQQQTEAYLANKYGLYDVNATWPSTYTAAVQAEITRNQWNKSQADAYVTFLATSPAVPPTGLAMWLKADAGTPTVGASITSASPWADQSPNKNNANPGASGTAPTFQKDANGHWVVQFNGANSSFLDVTDTPSLKPANAVTVVAVTQSTGTTQQDIVSHSLLYNNQYFALTPSYTYDLGLQSTGTERGYLGYGAGASGSYGDISSPTAEPTGLSTSILMDDGTNETISNNGISQNSSAIAGALNYDGTNPHDLLIGASQTWTGLQNYFSGNVAEVLVYNRSLNSGELLQAEAYLANKYNLPLSVPNGPTITPASSYYNGALTVTISTVPTPSSVQVRYTVDGTTPTGTSPLYSAPFPISATEQVQAAYFLNGTIVSPVTSVSYYTNNPGQTTLPAAPTGLTVTSVSSTQNNLTWTLNTGAAYDAINVYRSVNGGSYSLLAVLDPTATTFSDTTDVAGGRYTYEVGTINATGIADSTQSSAVTNAASSTLNITLTAPSGAVAQ